MKTMKHTCLSCEYTTTDDLDITFIEGETIGHCPKCNETREFELHY